MTSSNSSIGDSFWKPPVLKPGQYDRWVKQMKSHVYSLDGQLWKVIEHGPFEIMDEKDATKQKKEADYKDDDIHKMEKNHRAKKILNQALTEVDHRKVDKYETTHEIWNALKRLYEGNDNVKKNRIIAACRDYETAIQGNNETLNEFHSRFQGYVGTMEALGESVAEWKMTHHFLQSLNPKWDGIANALQAQNNIKSISLEDLMATLESQADIIERKNQRREAGRNQSIALMVERAFDKAQLDDCDDEEDEDIALMTRAFRMSRMAGRGKSTRGNPERKTPFENRESGRSTEERQCYHCQRKGHLIKDCLSLKRGEPPAQLSRKAMLAAYGDSDEDVEVEIKTKKCTMAKCTMARASNSEVDSNDISDDDDAYSVDEYKQVIEKLLDINRKLKKTVKERNKEIENLRVTGSVKDECSLCEETQDELKKAKETLSQLEYDNNELRQSLSSARASEEEKKLQWVKERETLLAEKVRDDYSKRFSGPGIGFLEELTVAGKTDKGECTCKDSLKQPKSGKHSKEKLKYPTTDSVPFEAEKAHKIWKKMCQNERPNPIDFHERKNNKSVPAGWSKYVALKCHKICWHCGKAGHYKAECHKLRKINERNHRKYGENRSREFNVQQQMSSSRGKSRATPHRKIDLSLALNTSHTLSKVTKPRNTKFIWVPKT